MNNISMYGQIELTRGDSFKAPLFINQGNEMCHIRYSLSDGDTLYFALMEPNTCFENAILKRVYTKDSDKTCAGDTYIYIYPKDTEHLIPGKYYYTIKLTQQKENGTMDVCTIIPETEFYIMR